jgi:hypothetical protein
MKPKQGVSLSAINSPDNPIKNLIRSYNKHGDELKPVKRKKKKVI